MVWVSQDAQGLGQDFFLLAGAQVMDRPRQIGPALGLALAGGKVRQALQQPVDQKPALEPLAVVVA